MMTDTNTKVIRLPMPYKKQREILLDKHRFKVLNLGRRTGLLQPDYFRYDGTRS